MPNMRRLQQVDWTTTDPIAFFNTCFEEATDAGIFRPEAFVLSTAGADGHPHGRYLLLKSADKQGFTFFTNYRSRKGEELEQNPYAALTFYWREMEMQVRVEGKVEKLDVEESDAYFRTRPRASQIGAWTSMQDNVLENREELDTAFERLTREYDGKEIPRPPHWGGYRCSPSVIEFWQEHPNRLHDRIECIRNDSGWEFHRLSP
ncbi:pyridoxamine 5'-phosphate oxidase [Patescibacteria group bacterium]|nr:pyridoxamine 5'-phosphate oxidase [Patescibacteria group bacterium]